LNRFASIGRDQNRAGVADTLKAGGERRKFERRLNYLSVSTRTREAKDKKTKAERNEEISWSWETRHQFVELLHGRTR